jgi:predicted lipoprotein with Yx(FWY)xxD motif
MKKTLLLLSLSTLLGACASMSMMMMPAKFDGGMLVGTNGMTLYSFDKDTRGDGKSVCVDKCAVNWPPLKAGANDNGSGDWSVITRPDGSKQWAYKGWPLYFWIKDQKPGDKTGDDVGKVWHIVKQ